MYHDAVSAYALIKRYRSTEYAISNSGWTLLDAAEQIFMLSKQRVYNGQNGESIKPGNTLSEDCFPLAEFEPEPCPKWQPLSELLTQDIPIDMRRRRGAGHVEPPKVLILCQDARTCYQLKQYLTQGGGRFLLQQAMRHEVPLGKLSERFSRDSQASAMAESESKTQKQSQIKQELPTQEEQPQLDELSQLLRDVPDVDAQLQQQLFEESYMLTMTQPLHADAELEGAAGGSSALEDANASVFEIIPELEKFDVSAALEAHRQPCICLQTFKTEREGAMALEHMLEQLQPHYVIMYNTNVTAIRQLEVFEARRRRAPGDRMKIYFLIHARTVEEQSYLTSLRREKAAFEQIINTKSVSICTVILSSASISTFSSCRKWLYPSIRMAKRMRLLCCTKHLWMRINPLAMSRAARVPQLERRWLLARNVLHPK